MPTGKMSAAPDARIFHATFLRFPLCLSSSARCRRDSFQSCERGLFFAMQGFYHAPKSLGINTTVSNLRHVLNLTARVRLRYNGMIRRFRELLRKL